MDGEAAIRSELRLFALESAVSLWIAAQYAADPDGQEKFGRWKAAILDNLESFVFPGALRDPALSDHLSAEFRDSLERLLRFQEEHLDRMLNEKSRK